MSVEMKVLQKEREKAVAEAGATGRRPRFPSRKVLEASGKLDNDGVQWMTKDMYKAEVQLRKDLRDRRKEEAATERKEESMLDTREVQSKRKIDCGASVTGCSGEQLPNVAKENTARAKRSHSNPSLGQRGKKISKRNPSTTTTRKGNDGIGMRDYSEGTGVPSGFFGKNINTNGVQLEGDGARNMECEPAGRS